MRLAASLAIFATAFAAATAATAASPSVKVTDAWCRPLPVSAPAGACYATLTAAANDRLIAVSTARANRSEIHTMDMTGGVMRMRQLTDGIALPMGQSVVLSPGGNHLMLIGPKRPFALGDRIPGTLRFEKAGNVAVEFVVQSAPPATHPSAH
jgi:copper(I)-binding protein